MARIRPPDDDIDRPLGQWCEEMDGNENRDLQYL